MTRLFSSTVSLIIVVTIALTVALTLTSVTVFGQIVKTGVYQGYNKKNTVLLFLFRDSTYKQQWDADNFSFVTFGKWKIRTDTVTLSPIAVKEVENKSESEQTMKNCNKIAIRKDTLDLLIYKNNIYKIFLPLTKNVIVFEVTSRDTINIDDKYDAKTGDVYRHYSAQDSIVFIPKGKCYKLNDQNGKVLLDDCDKSFCITRYPKGTYYLEIDKKQFCLTWY